MNASVTLNLTSFWWVIPVFSGFHFLPLFPCSKTNTCRHILTLIPGALLEMVSISRASTTWAEKKESER